MPLPFIAIAIPVLHSSGAWIASTASAGYIAGTLSGTWVGSFVLGNASLLSSLGLVSGAGIFAATGGLTAITTSAMAGIGSALTAVGLGGIANALGIAPVATFLGLTPIGWAIAGVSATLAGTLGFYLTKSTLRKINEEREKGGLEPTTLREIINEVRELERSAKNAILERLASESKDVTLSSDALTFTVFGVEFDVAQLRYEVRKDGSEVLVLVNRLGRKRVIFVVKSATGPEGELA